MSIAWLTITLEDGFRVVPAKNLRTGTSRDSRERAARAPRAHLTEFRSRAKRPVPERGKHGTGLSAGPGPGGLPGPGLFVLPDSAFVAGPGQSGFHGRRHRFGGLRGFGGEPRVPQGMPVAAGLAVATSSVRMISVPAGKATDGVL